jgi:hypothetical protein
MSRIPNTGCHGHSCHVVLQAIFQSAQHLYEKREGSGAESVPLTNEFGSGRPKNMRIRIPNTDRNVILGLLNLSTSTTTLMTRREPERSRAQTPAHWNLMVLIIIALPETYSAVSLLLPTSHPAKDNSRVCLSSPMYCSSLKKKKMKIIGQARLLIIYLLMY